jgi:hypothetical protein
MNMEATMTRLIFGVGAAVALLQSTNGKAQAPCCAVITRVRGLCIGIASIAQLKSVDRMCWQAVVAVQSKPYFVTRPTEYGLSRKRYPNRQDNF